jgi:release factor glutamine methyltransferase
VTTFGEALADARDELRRSGCGSAGLDARLLLSAASGLDAVRLIAREAEAMPATVTAAFAKNIKRRLAGEPVARILGVKEFWGLPFRIDASTLTPRPETEILVEAVIGAVPRQDRATKICDLGTGSGAIVVALLTELPEATAVAMDISASALEVARANAERHGVADRIRFRRGDFSEAPKEGFDVVVANPPYIRTSDIESLDVGVRDHDPRIALDGGPDGLAAHRAILERIDSLLRPGGIAAFEVGLGQGDSVIALCRNAGLTGLKLMPDLAGIGRVVLAALPAEPGDPPAKKALGKVA